MKVYATKENLELFETLGTKIVTDNTYYFFPFWIKNTEGNVYELFSLEKELPKDLVEFLEEERAKVDENKETFTNLLT